jgi:uncharacterized integral membrane protein
MQFLRTLFWVVVAIIAVIFANKNWTSVEINLWGGIVADVKLPILLLIAFIAGLLPPFILYQASRWQLRRRLDAAERTIAQLRPPVPQMTPAPVATDPLLPSEPEVPMPTAYNPPANGPVAS